MIDVPDAQDNTLTQDGSKITGLAQRVLAFAKREPLAGNALIFIGGFYLTPNGWWQLCGFLGLLMVQAFMFRIPDITQGLRQDGWMQAAAIYLSAGVIGSVLVDPAEASMDEVVRWLGGGALLLLFLLVVWQVGRDERTAKMMGRVVVASGAIAAVGSVIVFYIIMPDGLIGDRLKNWFVYGGLHPVCAGLMWGFAATWAACRWNDAAEGHQRRWWLRALVILTAATLLSLSRGALLSLGAGHAMLFMARGWRKAWKPCALLGGMV
ncbi:MAG: hypothetical protein JWO89_2198, partial [Verrucomicrobiaceae bacterium]|nr:hypothetical protein [Verrucomicrobiaceae bacterium]